MKPFYIPDIPEDEINLVHFFRNQIVFCNKYIAENPDKSRFKRRDVAYYQATIDVLEGRQPFGA